MWGELSAAVDMLANMRSVSPAHEISPSSSSGVDARGSDKANTAGTQWPPPSQAPPATATAAHYARIVREMATLRGLINAGGEIARLGWERPGETPHLVDRAEQVVFELAQARVSTDFSHIETLLKESFERITQLYEA